MSTTYIISWDQLGVECIFNATEADRQITFEMLKGTYDGTTPRHTSGSLLHFLELRARVNSQRHYEIYAIEVENDISQQDLEEMFESNPQGSADLIRNRGTCLYSDRADQTKVKIT